MERRRDDVLFVQVADDVAFRKAAADGRVKVHGLDLNAAPPPDIGTRARVQNLREQALSEWQADASLQRDFQTAESCISYRRGIADGRAKLIP